MHVIVIKKISLPSPQSVHLRERCGITAPRQFLRQKTGKRLSMSSEMCSGFRICMESLIERVSSISSM